MLHFPRKPICKGIFPLSIQPDGSPSTRGCLLGIYASCWICHLENSSSLPWSPEATEMGTGAANQHHRDLTAARTQCTAGCTKCGVPKQLHSPVLQENKFHKAPQEEISPKTPECRSGFQYYRAFGIKMVNVGLGAINTCENWLWFLNVLNRTQDKVDWFGCISGKTKQNKKRTSGRYGDSSIIHCLCLPSSDPWVQLSLTNTHTISSSFPISLRWQEKPSLAAVIC